MTLCERCRVYEATMLIDDEWMCEVCTSGAVDMDDDYPGFGDEDEHDPACRCADCLEAMVNTWVQTEGQLP